MKAHYLEISAEVSYWEDANVNGVDDIHGTLIPLREGNLWAPVIRLSDGVILNWPHGISAFDDYITLSIDTTGTSRIGASLLFPSAIRALQTPKSAGCRSST